jgi:hypothetical protein
MSRVVRLCSLIAVRVPRLYDSKINKKDLETTTHFRSLEADRNQPGTSMIHGAYFNASVLDRPNSLKQ